MRLLIALVICLAAVPVHAGQDAWACSTALAQLNHDAQQLNQVTVRGTAMLGRPIAEICATLTEGNTIAHRMGVELRGYVSRCDYIGDKSTPKKLADQLRLVQQRYATLCPSSHRTRRL